MFATAAAMFHDDMWEIRNFKVSLMSLLDEFHPRWARDRCKNIFHGIEDGTHIDESLYPEFEKRLLNLLRVFQVDDAKTICLDVVSVFEGLAVSLCDLTFSGGRCCLPKDHVGCCRLDVDDAPEVMLCDEDESIEDFVGYLEEVAEMPARVSDMTVSFGKAEERQLPADGISALGSPCSIPLLEDRDHPVVLGSKRPPPSSRTRAKTPTFPEVSIDKEEVVDVPSEVPNIEEVAAEVVVVAEEEVIAAEEVVVAEEEAAAEEVIAAEEKVAAEEVMAVEKKVVTEEVAAEAKVAAEEVMAVEKKVVTEEVAAEEVMAAEEAVFVNPESTDPVEESMPPKKKARRFIVCGTPLGISHCKRSRGHLGSCSMTGNECLFFTSISRRKR